MGETASRRARQARATEGNRTSLSQRNIAKRDGWVLPPPIRGCLRALLISQGAARSHYAIPAGSMGDSRGSFSYQLTAVVPALFYTERALGRQGWAVKQMEKEEVVGAPTASASVSPSIGGPCGSSGRTSPCERSEACAPCTLQYIRDCIGLLGAPGGVVLTSLWHENYNARATTSQENTVAIQAEPSLLRSPPQHMPT